MAKMELSIKLKYLIGVPERFLGDYDYNLENHLKWPIIRHLCSLRSKLIADFTELNIEFKDNHKNIGEIDDIKKLVEQVRADGIKLSDHPGSLSRVIMEVNDAIETNIDEIFSDDVYEAEEPEWVSNSSEWVKRVIVNQDYSMDEIREQQRKFPSEWIRKLFIIQDNSIDGIREQLRRYKRYRNYYPWQTYVNVNFSLLTEELRSQCMLSNDEILGDILRILNTNLSVGIIAHAAIYNSTIIVDCENSNPQRLLDTFRLVLPWVRKIVLINDVNGNKLWDEFTSIAKKTTRVEHIKVSRLKEQKSLVDFKMVSKTCEEYYMNGVRNFVFASSDSDIWALISSLPQADIYVLSERCKSGDFLEEALTQHHIPFAYMEDLVQDSTELLDAAVSREVRHFMEKGADKNRAVLNAVAKLKIFPSETEMERLLNMAYPVEISET